MTATEIAELQSLRERIVEVQALQVLLCCAAHMLA